MRSNALVLKVLFAVVLTFALILSGCDALMSLFGPPTETWTVAGTVSFDGTPSGTVKLAAFYQGQDTFSDTTSGAIISNVVTATDGGAFSLDIDASGQAPADLDTIRLIFWIDSNDDGAFDSTEDWRSVEPTDGCPVWDPTTYGLFCWFYYYDEADSLLTGASKGWNVYQDLLTLETVDEATLTGATIQNWLSF